MELLEVAYSERQKKVDIACLLVGKDAGFVEGLCCWPLNFYTLPLPLNQTGILTLTHSRLTILMV